MFNLGGQPRKIYPKIGSGKMPHLDYSRVKKACCDEADAKISEPGSGKMPHLDASRVKKALMPVLAICVAAVNA